MNVILRIGFSSVRGIARKLEVGKPYAADRNLVGADRGRCFEAFCASAGHKVILIDAITANAEATDKYSITVQAGASRKKHDATLLIVWWATLKALRARIRRIGRISIEKRARTCPINS